METIQSSMDVTIGEELIFQNVQAFDSKSVIQLLSDRLFLLGYVKNTFYEAVINREKKFPTGLPTEIPIAIPHTDPCHGIKPAFAIAILDRPVKFHQMGSPNEVLDIWCVFLLALTEDSDPIQWLRALVDFASNKDYVQQLIDAKNSEVIASILKQHISIK